MFGLVLRCVRPFASRPSWYVAGQRGQLSLLPSAGWEISTGQGAVAMLCSWEDNYKSAVTTPCIIDSVVYPLTDLMA